MAVVDLLPGFAWPVPRAFSAAVAVCRFEQGDLLYDDLEAYGAWPRSASAGSHGWVQVLDPPRTARSGPADAEGTRFTANWSSPVELALGRGSVREPELLRCTQGRLFTCLWRGDRSWLAAVEPGSGDDPPLPLGARELQKQLADAGAVLRERLPADEKNLLFAKVVDESSESSRARSRSVEAALRARYRPKTLSLSPAEAGVPNGDAFHPALRVQALSISESDPERLRKLLKQALYGPTRSAEEGAPDRFKLERHGLLWGGRSPD